MRRFRLTMRRCSTSLPASRLRLSSSTEHGRRHERVTLSTPYRGILLSDTWELCGGSADATVATMVAKDGIELDIAKKDLEAWPIMVAYQVDGENLIDDLGGPVKLVFPADARETYADDQWMWWLVEVKILSGTLHLNAQFYYVTIAKDVISSYHLPVIYSSTAPDSGRF